MGLCVMSPGLPGDSGTNGESRALSNQTVSICPHPNGGEVDGPGQTRFWNLSFFLSHAPPYTCCFLHEPLPASEAFLSPPLQQKRSGSSALWLGRLHIHQPVYNNEIFIIIFNVQLWETLHGIARICETSWGRGAMELEQHPSPLLPPWPSPLLLDFLHFPRVTALQPCKKVI